MTIKKLASLIGKKHASTLFMALAEGDKTFNELSALTTPTAVHEIMKRAEALKMVRSYYDKMGHKNFKLLVKGFEVELMKSTVSILY